MERSILEKMMEKAKQKIDFRDSLRANTDYIDWLVNFTNMGGGFDTSVLTYDGSKFNGIDKKNIENIETLYEVINEFAEKNYLVPHLVEFGNYYSIKYNDIGFYVGVDFGQGTSFYCTRLDEVEKDAIDYKVLVHNTKLPETESKEKKLEELSEMIIGLLTEDNVPGEVIEKKIYESFQKVKSNKNNVN